MDLDQLARAMAILGSLDPGKLPFHHAQVLLFIAKHEPVRYRDIEEAFDLSNASASRIVNSLGEHAKHRQECLGLVEVVIAPSEGRRYLVRLTKKGKAVRDAIKAVA